MKMRGMNQIRLWTTFVILGALFSGISVWDANAENSVEPMLPAEVHEGPVLTAGDRIKITIYPEDQYLKGGEMGISAEGNITLPLLGKLNVVGKSLPETEKMLARLLAEDYMVDPEVVVEIVGRAGAEGLGTLGTVSILGQVKTPGPVEYPAGGKGLTLLQAISKAGGFSNIANVKNIKVVRKGAGEKKHQMIRANAKAILDGKDPDIMLKPDDVVSVGESLF